MCGALPGMVAIQGQIRHAPEPTGWLNAYWVGPTSAGPVGMVWLLYELPILLNHKWWPHIVVLQWGGVPWTSPVHRCSFAQESCEPPVVVLQWEQKEDSNVVENVQIANGTWKHCFFLVGPLSECTLYGRKFSFLFLFLNAHSYALGAVAFTNVGGKDW